MSLRKIQNKEKYGYGVLIVNDNDFLYLPFKEPDLDNYEKYYGKDEALFIRIFLQPITTIHIDKGINIGQFPYFIDTSFTSFFEIDHHTPNYLELINSETKTIYDDYGYESFIYDIKTIDDKIIICGANRTFKDLDGNNLISPEETRKRHIEDIYNIIKGLDNKLYLHIDDKRNNNKIVELIYKNRGFHIGDIVIDYGEGSGYLTRIHAIGKNEFISTFYSNYLTINKDKIKGSEITGNGEWHELEIIVNNKDYLEIIVSGHNIHKVEYMKIDKKNREVIKRSTLLDALYKEVSALKIQRNKKIHNWLINDENNLGYYKGPKIRYWKHFLRF